MSEERMELLATLMENNLNWATIEGIMELIKTEEQMKKLKEYLEKNKGLIADIPIRQAVLKMVKS